MSVLAGMLAVFMASAVCVGAVLWVARRASLLDQPNERSSHTVATPKGGGIGVMLALIPAWLVLSSQTNTMTVDMLVLPMAATALAALSWWDDLRNLPVGVRLIGQITAVALVLNTLSPAWLVWGGALPPWLDHVVSAVAWLWFINLYNFMDGIDGLAAVETTTIGLGAAAVAVIIGAGLLAPYGLMSAAAALGFLLWNRAPAKIFLGDVGSVPLGFLLGWLLLVLATSGQWAAAIILPLYYWADATLTLIARARRGERVWQAHRQHFYQRAVQGGLSHGLVSAWVAVVNGALIMLAVASAAPDLAQAVGLAPLLFDLLCMAMAVAVVGALLAHFARQQQAR